MCLLFNDVAIAQSHHFDHALHLSPIFANLALLLIGIVDEELSHLGERDIRAKYIRLVLDDLLDVPSVCILETFEILG
jgi:hypothetical protein